MKLTNMSLATSVPVQRLGDEIQASVLFVDIADFTELAESAPAFEVAYILHEYFRLAGELVKANNGRIVDYYGDGFLAIFGVDGMAEHSGNAICTGFALLEAVEAFSKQVETLLGREFRIRLGAHCGSVIWGTIGITGMEKTAAIGDTVNLASRIEQANKMFQTTFLISEKLFGQYDLWPIISGQYEIRPKGKTGVYKVYALDRELIPCVKSA